VGERGGERAQYNLARVHAEFLDGRPAPQQPTVLFAIASLREGFTWPAAKVAILPEHRLLRRRKAPARRPARGALTSFTELRAGDPSCTRTTASPVFLASRPRPSATSPRLPGARVRDGAASSCRAISSQDQRYVGADARDPHSRRSAASNGAPEAARPQSGAGVAGELINLYASASAAPVPLPSNTSGSATSRAFAYQETPDQLRCDRAGEADMEERARWTASYAAMSLREDEVAIARRLQAAETGKQVMFWCDHRPRPAALRHVRRAHARLPVHDASGLALPQAGRGEAGARRVRRGKVDILIGRIGFYPVTWPKDLGLLVVDESSASA